MPSFEFMQSLEPDLETLDADNDLCFLLCSFLRPSSMWLSLRLVGSCSSRGAQMLLGAEEPKLSLFSQVKDDCTEKRKRGSSTVCGHVHPVCHDHSSYNCSAKILIDIIAVSIDTIIVATTMPLIIYWLQIRTHFMYLEPYYCTSSTCLHLEL